MKNLSSYILLLFLSFCFTAAWGYSDHRNRGIDSLEAVLRHEDRLSWEERILAHKELMWGYLQMDGERSYQHASAILDLTKDEKKGFSVRTDAFRLIGQMAYAECLYDSAMHCYERSLDVVERLMSHSKDYDQVAIDDALSGLYGTIGNLYNIQGMTTLALDYYLKALALFERNGWHESEAILYYNVGEMFLEMGNDEEAYRHYKLSEKAAALTNDSLIQTLPLTGLSMALLNMDKPETAMLMAERAMQYYSTHIDQEFADVMNTYVTMSRIAFHGFHDIPRAQGYLDEALLISERFEQDNSDVADAYAFQAELQLARREWQSVVDWCLRSLERNDEDIHHNVGTYGMLSKAYAHLGNADESERYLQMMHHNMETIANQQHQSALSEMQVRYETQKKEAQIAQMQVRQRLDTIIFVSVLVVLLLVALGVWLVSRQRRKVQLMRAKLLGERDERQRLARDLHDRLGGLLTATRLSLEGNRQTEALGLLQQSHAEMRKVAHHLMPATLSRSGLDAAIEEYCQVLPQVECYSMGTPVRFDEQQEVLAYCVVYELINNALKHAQAHHIQVQLIFEEQKLTGSVTDDGIGFVVSEATDGSGLMAIRERLGLSGGTFSVTSTPGKGTENYFTIPIYA